MNYIYVINIASYSVLVSIVILWIPPKETPHLQVISKQWCFTSVFLMDIFLLVFWVLFIKPRFTSDLSLHRFSQFPLFGTAVFIFRLQSRNRSHCCCLFLLRSKVLNKELFRQNSVRAPKVIQFQYLEICNLLLLIKRHLKDHRKLLHQTLHSLITQ